MACKPVHIDWNLVDQLLIAGCSGAEAAAYIGIYSDTLYDRCRKDKGTEFATYLQEKRGKGNAMLRAKKFDRAIKDGSDTMLIWESKNRLGEKDRADVTSGDEKLKTEKTIIVINGTEIEL
jgi:hypothetical protein